jgi:hypothetical protein
LTIDENGCTYWIEAGKLNEGDFLFSLRKKAHNKGKFNHIERICKYCGKKFYVQPARPSMKSFVNLDIFKKVKILSIKKFEYKQIGSKPMLMYDLTIENFHSFLCNSIIVSNSYLEYGTYSYWQKFGLKTFPEPGYPAIPKKKEISYEERKKLPKGMQPFAPFRRVLWNEAKMGDIIEKAAKVASR